MRYFILTTLLLITTLSYNLTAQQISSETYKKNYIHEDFNQVSETFKIVTTSDNYFILDKGDYLLSRNNNQTEYAIIANNSNVSDFILKTAVRIGPSENKKASVGIILKAQQNGKGAIIFEINKQREYRIKKLIGDTYQALSGKSKNKGWVKNKIVNGIDENNFIEIRSEKNVYDVYTNGEYLTTFFIPDFSNGSCGLIISPETKARISYYYINIKGENNIVADYKNDNTEDVTSTIEELNKRIKILEKNNTKLNELNTNTKGEQTEIINKLTAKNNELGDITDKQKEEISGLKQLMSDLTNNNNTLNTEITELKNQLTNSKGNNKNLNNEISTLTTKLNEINLQNNNLSTSTKEKTKEITLLTSTIKSLQASTKNANEKNKQLNKRINELRQEVSSEKSTNTKLTNELQKANKSSISTIKKLKNTAKTLEAKVNTLTTDLSSEKNTHKKTKSTLAKSVNNKIIEISKLKKELNEANDKLTALERTQKQHDEEIAKLNSQIVESNTTVTQLTAQIKTKNEKNKTLQTTNDELKDLFILMDFEINGVNPSEMRQETSDVAIKAEIIKEKTIYSVQFGVYMQEQPYNAIKNVNNVWFKTNELGTYFYYSGEFNSPQEATSHMNQLISKGYSDAFVVTLNE